MASVLGTRGEGGISTRKMVRFDGRSPRYFGGSHVRKLAGIQLMLYILAVDTEVQLLRRCIKRKCSVPGF